MQPNEIPLRTSYLNVTFKGLTYESKNPGGLTDDDLLRMYYVARKKAEQPIDQLIAEAVHEHGEDNVSISLLRHADYCCVYKLVAINTLCFDDGHESYGLFHGAVVRRGDSLAEFYTKHIGNAEIKASVDFINHHQGFFNKYIPIIVRPFGDRFEVVEGNHRSFCAIKNNETFIPALVATKEIPKKPQTGLDFEIFNNN